MIDPKDEPKAILLMKERIIAKKNLIKFTQMEIEELERTVEKMKNER